MNSWWFYFDIMRLEIISLERDETVISIVNFWRINGLLVFQAQSFHLRSSHSFNMDMALDRRRYIFVFTIMIITEGIIQK